MLNRIKAHITLPRISTVFAFQITPGTNLFKNLLFLLVLGLLSQGFTLALAESGDVYMQDQNRTIEFFDGAISKAPSGQPIGEINPRFIHHLTGVYLYCVLRNGSCPIILEGILETDIQTSKANGTAQCKNMLTFWQKWIANGFEQRVDYNLSTGHLNRYNEFKSLFRSRFLRCKDSVASAMGSSDDKTSYFSKRYGLQGSGYRALKKLVEFLRLLKDRETNVFIATGAYREAAEDLKKK